MQLELSIRRPLEPLANPAHVGAFSDVGETGLSVQARFLQFGFGWRLRFSRHFICFKGLKVPGKVDFESSRNVFGEQDYMFLDPGLPAE